MMVIWRQDAVGLHFKREQQPSRAALANQCDGGGTSLFLTISCSGCDRRGLRNVVCECTWL